MEKEQRVPGTLRKEWLIKKQRVRSRCARRIPYVVGVAALAGAFKASKCRRSLISSKKNWTKLSDQEIEVRLAAAVWVDDKLKDSAKTSHPKRTLILSVLSNGVEQI